MQATLMKPSQASSAWSLRSVTSVDGRRLITLWRGETTADKPATAKALPARSKNATGIAVNFAAETASAFKPAIHTAPVASKSQIPKTH